MLVNSVTLQVRQSTNKVTHHLHVKTYKQLSLFEYHQENKGPTFIQWPHHL